MFEIFLRAGEREVAAQIAQEKSNQKIASELFGVQHGGGANQAVAR
jgi:hypothetical protein